MTDPFHELRLEAEYSNQLKRLIDEYDALLAVVRELREGAEVIVAEYESVGGPEVHRSWRDVMLQQKREVSPKHMEWRSLPQLDKFLDGRIASATALDFLVWWLGHSEALAALPEHLK